ncbi:hypothetical protein BGW36DRAFT_185896 [Talaromyces proteolyticus]|uniref:Uncharacterized protein n=1 Tax=Talaromyces proteolyticus TaxID=1131652 RepID=A0AAD4PZV7_9EURO|nr:uncharacterized protein BGW36DRAFT_185896 [Talaromyces proteolyticus]KAH8696381.1 hypothetical protein BGW36DRAFT_185896 [Talaromyces proteolyticus]
MNPSDLSQIPHQLLPEVMDNVITSPDNSSLSDYPTSDDQYWDNIEESEFPTQSSSTPLPQIRSQQQDARRTRKLNEVLKVMSKNGWSPATFIRLFIAEKGDLRSRRYKTPFLRHKEMQKILHQPFFLDLFLLQLHSEFNELIQQSHFGKYDESTDLENVNFQDMLHTIQVSAPLWNQVLSTLLVGPRSQNSAERKALISITSIICFSRAPLLSNFLAKSLAIYLYSTGTKTRSLDTLNGMGICSSYKTVQRLIPELARNEKETTRKQSTNPQSVITYDNMNFKDTKRDEHAGHKAVVTPLTNRVVAR